MGVDLFLCYFGRSSRVVTDKKKAKKPKRKQSDAVYELERYHQVALDISKNIFEHVDRKRYMYPVMMTEEGELSKWDNDYLFAQDIAQFWKSPGRKLSETEWKEVLGNRG